MKKTKIKILKIDLKNLKKVLQDLECTLLHTELSKEARWLDCYITYPEACEGFLFSLGYLIGMKSRKQLSEEIFKGEGA